MKFQLNKSSVPPAIRVVEKNDCSIQTPNSLAVDCQSPKSIAAILHVFYPELMSEIAQCLNNFEDCPDLFISTDSEEKALQIRLFCQQYPNWNFDIRVVDNRGRDIAPMIIEFRDVFYKYEYCLHLHTKKTLHKSAVAKWREYLFYTLCGTKEIVSSNLALIQHKKIGFVFPQNINVYRHNLSWGHRFSNVQQLLANSAINIFSDTLLEFPTSTMFFARTEALRKLIDQNLQINDFDAENYQITATLAHDIETSLLYFVEASGYRWVKVSYNHGNLINIRNSQELDAYLDNVVPCLLIRRTVELEKLTLNSSEVSFIRRKLFNAWQKLVFRYWMPKPPLWLQIKYMSDL